MQYSLFPPGQLSLIKENGFNRSPPSLANPTVLGRYAFELDGTKRKLVQNPDRFILRYSPIKLAEGETVNLQPTDDEKIQDDREILKTDGDNSIFLQHILDNRDVYKSRLEESGVANQSKPKSNHSKKTRLLNTDFVCLRGVLCNLMNCQYEPKKILTVFGEYYEGTIYLDIEKRYLIEEEITLHDYAKRKFQLMSTSTFDESVSGQAGDQRQATNATEADAEKLKKLLTHSLCFVFKSQLGSHSLFYSGDMECFESFPSSDQTDSSQIFTVVFRAAKTVENEFQAFKLKHYKTMKWYCHSLFTGNTKFAVASWPKDHIANEIKELTLDDLIEIADGEWNKDVCLHQLNRILQFIKTCFDKQHNASLLKFVLQEHPHQIVCERSDKPVLSSKFKDELSGDLSWRR